MREAIELKDATPMYFAQPLEVKYTTPVLVWFPDPSCVCYMYPTLWEPNYTCPVLP